jgi:hypothetical protein
MLGSLAAVSSPVPWCRASVPLVPSVSPLVPSVSPLVPSVSPLVPSVSPLVPSVSPLVPSVSPPGTVTSVPTKPGSVPTKPGSIPSLWTWIPLGDRRPAGGERDWQHGNRGVRSGGRGAFRGGRESLGGGRGARSRDRVSLPKGARSAQPEPENGRPDLGSELPRCRRMRNPHEAARARRAVRSSLAVRSPLMDHAREGASCTRSMLPRLHPPACIARGGRKKRVVTRAAPGRASGPVWSRREPAPARTSIARVISAVPHLRALRARCYEGVHHVP